MVESRSENCVVMRTKAYASSLKSLENPGATAFAGGLSIGLAAAASLGAIVTRRSTPSLASRADAPTSPPDFTMGSICCLKMPKSGGGVPSFRSLTSYQPKTDSPFASSSTLATSGSAAAWRAVAANSAAIAASQLFVVGQTMIRTRPLSMLM